MYMTIALQAHFWGMALIALWKRALHIVVDAGIVDGADMILVLDMILDVDMVARVGMVHSDGGYAYADTLWWLNVWLLVHI